MNTCNMRSVGRRIICIGSRKYCWATVAFRGRSHVGRTEQMRIMARAGKTNYIRAQVTVLRRVRPSETAASF